MFKYVLQRILYLLLTMFVIASVTFFLMKMLPGTPFNLQDKLPKEQQEQLMKNYGLDKPVAVQYVSYLKKLVVEQDLGISFKYDNRPVSQLIGSRIGPSARLGLQALLFGSLVGLFLGVLAALRHNTVWDYSATVIAVLGASIPSFVFAGYLQYFFGVKWPILPIVSTNNENNITAVGLILPTLALSVAVIAQVARYTRSEMLEVLGSDYITLAKAKGINSNQIIWKHAIRNGLIPVITILGPIAANIMTGSLVIESIFGIPGIGQQFVTSVVTNDYPTIMGVTLFYSLFFVTIILIVDILYGVIDPRIRISGGGK